MGDERRHEFGMNNDAFRVGEQNFHKVTMMHCITGLQPDERHLAVTFLK
jgi:hypothetical protein